MAQSTKLFLILLFLFIVYTTMNGHLEEYIKIMLGKKAEQSTLGKVGGILGKVNALAQKAAKTYLKATTGAG